MGGFAKEASIYLNEVLVRGEIFKRGVSFASSGALQRRGASSGTVRRTTLLHDITYIPLIMIGRYFSLCLASLFLVIVVGVGQLYGQPIRIDFRLASIGSGDALDIHFNSTATPTINNVGPDSCSGVVTNLQIPTSPLNVKVVKAGTGIASPIFDRDLDIVTQTEYVGVVYGDAGSRRLKFLSRLKSQNPTTGKSLIRVFNAVGSDVGSLFDFYIESTDSTPLFTQVPRDSATPFKSLTGAPTQLIITPNGSRNEIARFNVPLVELGRMTLVITGADAQNLKVYALSGERQTAYAIPVLQGAEGGTLPSVRVFHAWPERAISGKGIQSLDIYLDNSSQPSGTDLRYRMASAKFGPLTGDSVNVHFTLRNEGVGSTILTEGVRTRLDSDYVVIMTKFRTGTAIGMTLAAPNTVPSVLDDSLFIRVAQATDYHGQVLVEISSYVTDDTLRVTLPFLAHSPFYRLAKGPYRVRAFRDGDPLPIATVNDVGSSANLYFTVIVAGDDTTVTLDILDEFNAARQVFDPTVSVPWVVTPPSIRLLPNIASTRTRVEIPDELAGRVAGIDLVDVTGRIISSLFDRDADRNVSAFDVDLHRLASGFYFIRIRTIDGAEGVERLVVAGTK